MNKQNIKKSNQLGMPFGTAQNRLKKNIFFYLVKSQKLDICFRCGQKISEESKLSIDHKKAWLDSDKPVELFFDIDNISFSHLSCNSGSGRRVNKGRRAPHGKKTRYREYGCRCGKCKEAQKLEMRKYRRLLAQRKSGCITNIRSEFQNLQSLP